MAEAQQRCDSREFSEWIAYYKIEPFGEQPANWRSGMLAALIANITRRKGGQKYKPADFMPKIRRARPRQSAAQMFKTLGGLIRPRKDKP